MTAMDELRRLLDERGVEWRKTPHYSSESQDNETVFAGDGIEWYANDHLNGKLGLRAARYEVTPEQAIDATLGETPTPPPPTPPKQPPYDELIESLWRDWDIEASWDGLRRFWYVGLTDEGVRKRDERESTLERGTCRDVGRYCFTCSECGWTADEPRHALGGFLPNYCPNCGRKVVGA